MKKNIISLACLLMTCIVLQTACTWHPAGNDKKITLRSLDGASVSDTLSVNETLPLLPQREDALYHIQSLSGIGETKPIFITDVISPEYRIIPLETSEECIIGHVDDVVRDDSLLLVVDQWNSYVYSFDLNGKFLNRIGRKGHAEDEYVEMMNVAIDKRNNRVCVYDGDSQKLVFYDYQGNFLGKESLYFEFRHMAFANDGSRVFLTLPYTHEDYKAIDAFQLTVTDGKGMPLHGVLPDKGYPKYKLDNSPFAVGIKKALHSNPDGVYYIDILNPDTIWRVNEKECVPFLAADFGEPFTTPESYREMTTQKYSERMNQVKYLHDDFIFTKDFGYMYMAFSERAVLNLKTGKYMTGELSRKPRMPFKNFQEFTYESFPNEQIFLYDWEKNQIVKMWDAAELVRRMKMITSNKDWYEVYQTWPKDERDFLEHLTQEDNPVLVVATLKEFENEKETD